jgi:hypothetical protein
LLASHCFACCYTCHVRLFVVRFTSNSPTSPDEK